MTDLSSLGASSAGVWTRADVVARTSVGRYDALVRRRGWQTPWPGVHADGGSVLTAQQTAHAAVLASGGPTAAYACGRTAARLWGLPLVDDDDPATGAADHVNDDVGVRCRAGALRNGARTMHRRQLRLGDGELVTHPSGVACTSVARTLVDCAGVLSTQALVCAVDAALHRHLVTPDQLDALVAARAGTRSVGRLREAVRLGDGRAEAPSESLLRLLVVPHFPRLVPQVLLVDAAARPVARFDLADDVARVAVEADGRAGHEGAVRVARDHRRDRATRELGWLTERVTWFDTRRRPGEVVARVAAAYRLQRAAAA